MSIADLIANKLINGVEHPGDPANGEQPFVLQLPFFQQPSMPPEVQQHIDHTTKMLAEALVHAIETEGDSEIIARGELQTLRDELAQLRGEAQ